MIKKIFVGMATLLIATPALAWQLQWNTPPAAEEVTTVRVFEDSVQIDEVLSPGTVYALPATLPEACWQVQPVNVYGIAGDLSNQVCVGRPSALDLQLVQ